MNNSLVHVDIVQLNSANIAFWKLITLSSSDFVRLELYVYTGKLPNKGHFGNRSYIPASEIVQVSEVDCYLCL